jgi:hypothetical protein
MLSEFQRGVCTLWDHRGHPYGLPRDQYLSVPVQYYVPGKPVGDSVMGVGPGWLPSVSPNPNYVNFVRHLNAHSGLDFV